MGIVSDSSARAATSARTMSHSCAQRFLSPHGQPRLLFPQQGHKVRSGRPDPAIGIQPLGGPGGRERCRAARARSDVPAHRFGEDLGAWGGSDFSAATIPDRLPYPRSESRRACRDQLRFDCRGGNSRIFPVRGAGHGLDRDSGPRPVAFQLNSPMYYASLCTLRSKTWINLTGQD